MLLTFFKGWRISKINTVLNTMVLPLFFKEGLGKVYQSIIMKLHLTDQHYSDQEGLFILLPVIRYQK